MGDKKKITAWKTGRIDYSLLLLMERLSAMERAVFILRESFDYAHQEIAGRRLGRLKEQ